MEEEIRETGNRRREAWKRRQRRRETKETRNGR
jgi:hypothetical protein